MGDGPRTLALEASQGRVYTELTGRAIIVIVIERVVEREEKEREMERDREKERRMRGETHTREERETLPCVCSERFRVFLQNAPVCTFKTSASNVTRTFLKYTRERFVERSHGSVFQCKTKRNAQYTTRTETHNTTRHNTTQHTQYSRYTDTNSFCMKQAISQSMKGQGPRSLAFSAQGAEWTSDHCHRERDEKRV